MNLELKTLIETAASHVANGQWQDASRIYASLAELIPQEPDVHHLHGLVLKEQHKWQSALQQIDRAISIQPDQTDFRRSRGDVLEDMGAMEAARKTYQQVLAIDPGDHHAMINLGNILYRQNQPEQALEWYQRTLALDPENTCAMNNIGKIAHDSGHLELALEWYGKALCREPDYAEARFNRAVGLLAMGDYAEGWKEYEWRFRRKTADRVYPHRIDSRRWNGSSFIGQRLLVHCEQGMGDIIQFCRYLPEVKALGGELTVEVHAPLVPLLCQMPEIDHVVAFDPEQPPSGKYELYLPMLSLPFLFQTTLDTIPAHVPYIQPSPAAISRWKTDAVAGEALCVGMVWSGSATDPNRDCPFPLFQELLTVPGIRFFSLQKKPAGPDAERLRPQVGLSHWGDRLNDFDETAAAIHCLDLIVSVDTATAHLAGAMGKPVWILLPFSSDWRWLGGRQDSPWYPTARLFRQPEAGDWQSVIRQVKSELSKTSQARRFRSADNRRQAEELFNRGAAHHHDYHLKQAISCYLEALSLAPDLEAAYRNLGLAFYQTNDLNKAAECYRRSLEIRPDAVVMLLSLGAIYAQVGRHSEAEALYRNALNVDPDNASVHFNLGNLYLETGHLESAAAQYHMILDKDSEHPQALCNLGRTRHRQGDPEQALRLYERALKVNPDQPIVHVNRAAALLLQGKWQEGWEEYEWRLKGEKPHCVYPHRLTGRRWTGEPFAGKTLLIHGEQGFGDAIQFVRFLPMVKALGGRVILETHASLINLFATLDSIDQCIALSAQHPPQVQYDLYIPLCSLARQFNIYQGNIPATVPYLHAEDKKAMRWRSRLPARGLNVGITWAGSDTYPERSCALQDFIPLGRLQGINWIGLQKGPATSQVDKNLSRTGPAITNWGEEFQDFSDTAAAIANLDLVISIDTAVAHLAGALGKPVWLLLPKVADWRWLITGKRSPWYPTMHLFRQKQSACWETAMIDVLRQMQTMTSTTHGRPSK
jgi:tetratricopeptide (TPR) repeat protein